MNWLPVALDLIIIALLVWVVFRQTAMVNTITDHAARTGQAIYDAITSGKR